MTITSDRTSPPITEPEYDRRPGSSDVEWAERAYRNQEIAAAERHRRVLGTGRRRLRIVVAALVGVLAMAGVAVAMTYQGSSPAAVVHRSAPAHTAAAPRSATAPSHVTPIPQLFRPFPTRYRQSARRSGEARPKPR